MVPGRSATVDGRNFTFTVAILVIYLVLKLFHSSSLWFAADENGQHDAGDSDAGQLFPNASVTLGRFPEADLQVSACSLPVPFRV